MAKPKYRSPKYSRINLQSALEKAQELIARAADKTVRESDIAKMLGYAGLTGRSIAVLSAMKKYKILEPNQSGFKLTSAAIEFFESNATATGRCRIIERFAYAPALFYELFNEFNGQLPPDSEFEEFLERHNFNPASFAQIIKIYRQNYQMVEDCRTATGSGRTKNNFSADPSRVNSKILETDSIPVSTLNNSAGEIIGQTANVRESSHEMNFTLSENTAARIFLYGNISASDIEKLIKFLGIYKENFPSV